MSQSYKDALEFTLRWEGGYVDHPNDPGGRTYKGISERAHPDAWKDGKPSEEVIEKIYREKYWDRVRGDDLPPMLAMSVFDWAVNSGVYRASNRLQQLVGAYPDGKIGDQTLNMCAVWMDKLLATALVQDRDEWLQELVHAKPKFKAFQKGWKNRTDALEARIKGE